MGRLKTYLWRYWRRYLVGGICLLSTATLVMWIPWWIRDAVRIIENGGSLRDVRFYAAVIGAAALLQGVVRTCSRALIFNAGRDVEYDLRNDLFAHLQKLPLSFYHSQRTGDLMSRVINDISAVRVMLGPGILNFVNAPVYLVYALVLMLSMDVRMTLAALAPFPLLIFAVAKFRGRILKSSLEVQQQMSALSSHVQENLSGMHVVKAYTQERFQTHQFIALNDDFQAKSLELARMRGIITPVMQGFNALTVLIVLWYGGVRVIRGDLLVADIVAFVAYLNVLAWPTAAFGWMLSLVERGRAAMKRLEEILKTEPEIASPGNLAASSGSETRNRIPRCLFCVRPAAQWPSHARKYQFFTARWSVSRSRGPDRFGEEHGGAVGAAPLRCVIRRNSHGRKGYSKVLPPRAAPDSRLCPPGPISVFDFTAAQFGLWPGRSLR